MNPQDAILTRFASLHPKKIDLSLGRIEKLLADLGAPQKGLPPVIHVAGTNGKGSTIAYMRGAGGRGQASPCLHVAAPRTVQRAHPSRWQARR
jgi:dihydrofolate synthase / folylpolyglutamate synthase